MRGFASRCWWTGPARFALTVLLVLVGTVLAGTVLAETASAAAEQAPVDGASVEQAPVQQGAGEGGPVGQATADPGAVGPGAVEQDPAEQGPAGGGRSLGDRSVAGADAPGEAAERLTLAALADLLEDPAARAHLVAELRRAGPTSAPAAPEDGAERLPQRLAQGTQRLALDALQEVEQLGEAFLDVPWHALTPERPAVLAALWRPVALIAATFLAFGLLRAMVRPLHGRLDRWSRRGDARASPLRHALAVVLSLVVDALVIAVAWAAGQLLATTALTQDGSAPAGAALFLYAFLATEAAKTLLRALFASHHPELRLIWLEAGDAAYWNARLALLVGFVGYGMLFAAPWLDREVDPALGEALSATVALLALAGVLVLVALNRTRVRDRLLAAADRRDDAAARVGLRVLGRLWHVLVMLYFAAFGVVAVTRPETALPFMAAATAESLLTVTVGVLISRLLDAVLREGVPLPQHMYRRLPPLEPRLRALAPRLRQVGHWMIAVAVILVLIGVWDLGDPRAWLASSAGLAVVGTFVTVGLIIAASTVLWVVVASWVEHRLEPAGGRRTPSARERTLLTLFRTVIAVTIATVTLMIVLAELGVNVAPMIASAGVLGLAIGFGSQKLVQDVITGVFIQLDNAIHIGDWVSVAGLSGTVEKINIRALGLRDLAGTYHIVPFSAVTSVSNFVRGHGYHMGVYGVAYREDTDEVTEHLRAAFEELREDPTHGPHILEDLEVHGVVAFGSSSVDLRVRIKTTAGNQWAVGRAYNRLVKKHFDAAGIEIPFPHTTLYFGQDKDGSAPAAPLRIESMPGPSDGGGA